MNNTANITIDIFTLILSSIGILTSIGILILIFHYRHQSPFNIPTLLYNNYLSVIFCCLILLDIYAYNLYGDIHRNISFDNWWCYVRAYFFSVALASLYHSYLLQALFRLFRIVFYKYRQLQKFRFMFCLVLIQWLMDFLLFIPTLVLHHFEYVSQNYYCQVLYTNLRGMMSIAITIYYFPMIVIASIYLYIIYYMKQGRELAIRQNRRQTNKRDLIVLRRILILIGMLFMVSFPAFMIYLWYIISGYLYQLIYQLQWMSFAVGLSILPVVTAVLTPQLRELLKLRPRLNHRIQPIITIQQYELQQTNIGP